MNADKFQFSQQNPLAQKRLTAEKNPFSQQRPLSQISTPPPDNQQSHASPTTWVELIEQGDGYLTPAQRQAFDQAILMVTECMQKTLGKSSTPAEQAEYFDFSHYVDTMESRFLNEVKHESELQQDVSLTAARIIQHIAHQIRQ